MADTKINKDMQELVENMDAMLYRLNLLCNRFEKDKDQVLKESLGMKEIIKALQEEIDNFTQMREKVGEIFNSRLEKASDAIVLKAKEGVQEIYRENLKETVTRLDGVLYRMQQKMEYFYDLDKKRIIWMAIGFVILPIIAGVFTAKLFMSKPILSFDKEICKVYEQRCSYVR
jgi:uncharacterized protein YicC (UPF0701 family)